MNRVVAGLDPKPNPAPRLMTLHALLQRFAGDPTERVKEVERFIEEHGDPRVREDAWFLPDEPLLGFVDVPAGPFSMGSDPERDSRSYDDETPQHEVTLPAYYIARYPVTVAQFRAYVEDGGRTPEDPESLRGPASHPVVQVTWHEAVVYCRWLSEKLGASNEIPADLRRLVQGDGVERPWQVTLPSEAEWEKAVRGTDGRIYPWGNEADANRANYDDTYIDRTTAVGCFPGGVSPFGVEELSGNVLEWTRSVYKGYPYEPTDGREDLTGADDALRALRGGAFDFTKRFARAAVRSGGSPRVRSRDVGFRVVVSRSLPDLGITEL